MKNILFILILSNQILSENEEIFQLMKQIDQKIFTDQIAKRSLFISTIDDNKEIEGQFLESEYQFLNKWQIQILQKDNTYLLQAEFG